MNSWAETDRLMRLVEKALVRGNPDSQALVCYGLLVRGIGSQMAWEESIWLHFVAGNPELFVTQEKPLAQPDRDDVDPGEAPGG
jgi:hypothetical protein